MLAANAEIWVHLTAIGRQVAHMMAHDNVAVPRQQSLALFTDGGPGRTEIFDGHAFRGGELER
jgi:hypothetical protein